VSKLARNVFIPTSYSVWTAPLGTALPTSPLTAPSAAFYEVGFLSDQGVTEGRDINETLIYDLVGQLVATARNQEARPFTFEALEDNRVVRELRYPNSTLATVAGTAEVQTITLTGTGTAGTWSLTLPGYGTASALTYNITTSALATALNAAFGVSGITVSGTAGSSYIVTFPASMGNVALMISTRTTSPASPPSASSRPPRASRRSTPAPSGPAPARTTACGCCTWRRATSTSCSASTTVRRPSPAPSAPPARARRSPSSRCARTRTWRATSST
jgi:hypothetical protein